MANGDDQLSPMPSRSEFLAGLRKRAPQLVDIPDDTLWKGVVKRRPEVQARIRPDIAPDPYKQTQQKFSDIITGGPKAQEAAQTKSALSGMTGLPQTGYISSEQAKSGLTTGAEIGGAEIGGAVVAGRGILPMALRALGAGTGAAIGHAATTGDPYGALKTGGKYAAGSVAAETGFKLLGSAGKAIRRFWSVDPERFASLADLSSVEEKTRMAVQSRAPEARKMISESYPVVRRQVRIMPPARVAQEAEAGMVAEPAPKQVSKVAEMGRERQRAVLRAFSRAMPALRRLASEEGTQADVEHAQETLRQLRLLQGISFRDAQKLYSSLGRAMAKGEGWKLPGETYHALSESREALEDMMRQTLRKESATNYAAKGLGVMPEEPTHVEGHTTFQDSKTGGHFYLPEGSTNPQALAKKVSEHRREIGSLANLSDVGQQTRIPQAQQRFQQWQPQDLEAQWDKAQALHKQMIDDFYRADGPLTKIMKAKPDERGEVLSHLLRDPKTRVRATEAMQRWGIDTGDIQRLAQKWRDPVELHRAIEDTARMEQLGAAAFGKQETQAYRTKVGKQALKWGAGAALGGGTVKLYEMLRQQRPTLNR